MLRLTTILAPTDFSRHSSHAVRYAAGLARRFGAALLLLHVVADDALESIAKGHVPPLPVDRVCEDLNRELHEQYATQVAPEVREDLQVEGVVVPGVPFLEIIHAARLRGVDLIVMATHGRTGLRHALVGSVTERGGPEGAVSRAVAPTGGCGGRILRGLRLTPGRFQPKLSTDVVGRWRGDPGSWR